VFLGFVFLWCFFGGGLIFDFYLFSFGSVEFSLSFLLDYVSVGFFSCVSLISGVVFFYSNFYMDGDLNIRRFSYLVFMFVFSMLILVFSGNFVLTIVGWDGLGLVSFCLVIYYSNSSRLDSGLVTVFRNRVGDVFFCWGFIFSLFLGLGGMMFFVFGEGFCFSVLFFLVLLLKGLRFRSLRGCLLQWRLLPLFPLWFILLLWLPQGFMC